MTRAYLGLGSNLGDRLYFLQQAVGKLQETNDITIKRASPVYETEPVGVTTPQPPYYNAALEIETRLSPMDLLQLTKDIEFSLGRRQKEMKDSRYLDLDILSFGNFIINTPVLQLPHPLLEQRWFVLVPLNDIAPHCKPPGFIYSFSDLLSHLGPPQGLEMVCDSDTWIKHINEGDH